jgi:N-acetyl-alpha-D-muramate 1-phosphate uridylyltransferase
MADSVAAIVLAAGLGTRLAPLTRVLPKALCPVGNVPLVDLALDHVAPLTTAVAVNVHAQRDRMVAHLGGRAHLSIEEPAILGTAGAVGRLRDWVAGRPAVVVNADSWHRADLRRLVAGWDGERVRLLVAGGPGAGLLARTAVCASLLPWSQVRALRPEPSGLYEVCWRPQADAGRLDLVGYDGPFFDCGTPHGYLAANMAVSGGSSVVGEEAVVAGELIRSVVWAGGVVRGGEVLVDAVRVGKRLTVLVR